MTRRPLVETPLSRKGRMKAYIAGGLAAIVLAGVGVRFADAQAVVSAEEFDRAMKTIGTAVDSVNQSIGSGSYLEAKTPLALSRQMLASTRPWWVKRQEPDAAQMTRLAVLKLDTLDKVLSAGAVDAAAVAAAVGDVDRACNACHTIYREGDSQTGYRIKSRPENRQ